MTHNNSNKKPPFSHQKWVNTGIVVSIAPQRKDQPGEKIIEKSERIGSPEAGVGDKAGRVANSDKTH